MNHKSYKYPLLNDSVWLRHEYIDSLKSTKVIGDIVGCGPNSVRQALIGHNIPVRSISAGLLCSNAHINIDRCVIDGGLLGDASLRMYNPTNASSGAHYVRKNKFKDHIRYVAGLFYGCDIDDYIFPSMNTCNGKDLLYHEFRTRATRELYDYYHRWYINGIKRVPRDIHITPTALLHWFMDDGSAYHRRRSSPTKQVVITLSCECFTVDDIDFLVGCLMRDVNLPFRKSKCNSGVGFRISLPQSYTQQFYSYIGECPVDSLRYKWR